MPISVLIFCYNPSDKRGSIFRDDVINFSIKIDPDSAKEDLPHYYLSLTRKIVMEDEDQFVRESYSIEGVEDILIGGTNLSGSGVRSVLPRYYKTKEGQKRNKNETFHK